MGTGSTQIQAGQTASGSSVRKDWARLPSADLRQVIDRIGTLATNPRGPGSEKLSGHEYWRIRQGRYRILYSIQDAEQTVWIVKIAHRKDVYRKG
jgi:mRNA interferase RelE/StbE